MRIVITYDIHDDSNRRRVYQTLQRYGAWRQFSVFEAEVSKTERIKLRDELENHIETTDGDRIRIYRICSSCQDDITDLGNTPPDNQSNVI
ncbi:CRISPR-associated endonuclease Cas2 [Haloarchaeobius amylolyticus]|uniref:CRISPR-associated endonuclease Cas2 n=1 Tax=Haloarchaeobius amylolyticus TaxID=1198296 RepID=UPI0034A4C543